MVDFANLRSVDELVKSNPSFTPGGLRWLIFHAKENGLEVAIVRVGRRVYIDQQAFNGWLENQRAGVSA